jgi:tetratricopeptide (TPR) repeat protein
LVLSLSSLNIDIPAGTNSWAVEDNFTLPVGVQVLAVLPHAHYLGKRLEGSARLPDGTRRQLLTIPDWDFNWQGDYRYLTPVQLPAGSSLHMRFSYDNSADNPRNPNQPPREVQYGPQSSDEMAELWFQVRLGSTNDQAILAQAYNEKNRRMFASYDEFRLQRDPHDARARTELGFLEWTDGHLEKAIELLRTATADDPGYDQPHYYLGVIYRTQNRLIAARSEFETALRLNPKNSKALGNLAYVFMGLGNLDRAERSIREAVRLDPTDRLARETLENISRLRKTTKPQ